MYSAWPRRESQCPPEEVPVEGRTVQLAWEGCQCLGKGRNLILGASEPG